MKIFYLLITMMVSKFKMVACNQAYDYFRALFDNQTTLLPRDMDLITNQILANVSGKKLFYLT